MKSKFAKVMIALASALVMGLMISTISTSAATWHRGTPKALRGTYQSRIPHSKNPAAGFSPIIMVTKNRVSCSQSNNPEMRIQKLRYYKKGHFYYFKGVTKHIGFILGGKTSFKLYKKGSKLYMLYGKGTSLKRAVAYYKTSHPVNYRE